MSDRGVIAIVPVRSLSTGKTRLSGELSAEKRSVLTERMLRGVIAAAVDSGVVNLVAVVSPDPDVAEIALQLGPSVTSIVQSVERPGLNPALTLGRDWAAHHGFVATLILFADLPLLTGEDVRNFLRRDAPVVLAADRHGEGTNALMLRLGGRIERGGDRFEFQFGPGSFARHVEEAHRLGLEVATSNAAATAIDLDTPEDWHLLLKLGGFPDEFTTGPAGRAVERNESMVAEKVAG